MPYEGRNDQIGGYFARDNESGSIYLMHSGRVAGGMRGVGKSTFLAWRKEPLVSAVDASGGVRLGVVVMPVAGKGATHRAVRYVDSVAGFKQAVRAGETATPEFRQMQREFDEFFSESRGRRRGNRSSEIDYLSRHGDIVDALNAWRSSQSFPNAARIVKNALIDLGVAVGRDLIEVYEVKTSAARFDIYSAIGQLMVHGTANTCRRVLLVPDKEALAPDLSDALQRLGVKLLRFVLDEEKATIL